MGGTLECYFDIASFYSYMAFHHVMNNRSSLEAHGVDVNINPIWIVELFQCSGNRPPWVIEAKRHWYHNYESVRAKEEFGLSSVQMPQGNLLNLKKLGHTEKPMSTLLYLKQNYSRETFETAFLYLFNGFWVPPQRVVKDPEILAEILAEIPADFVGRKKDYSQSKPLFSTKEVQAILEASANGVYEQDLKNITHQLGDKGAFGLPFFIARNSEGKEEPFFGSDRFNHIYKFLGVPYQDLTILPKEASTTPESRL